MGIFGIVMITDMKVIFRVQRLPVIAPVLYVFTGVLLRVTRSATPDLIAVVLTMSQLITFGTMFARTGDEQINYHVTPAIGREVVAAKNASSLLMYFAVTVPAVLVPSAVLGNGADFAVAAVSYMIAMGSFMMAAGNIVSVRVIRKKIPVYTILNVLLMSLSMSAALVLVDLLSGPIGAPAAAAVCLAIAGIVTVFSLDGIARSLERAMRVYMEVA